MGRLLPQIWATTTYSLCCVVCLHLGIQCKESSQARDQIDAMHYAPLVM